MSLYENSENDNIQWIGFIIIIIINTILIIAIITYIILEINEKLKRYILKCSWCKKLIRNENF